MTQTVPIIHKTVVLGNMYKTLFVLALLASLVLVACGGDDEYDAYVYEERRDKQQEQYAIEHAVLALMVSPQIYVDDLTTDSRLACGEGGCVMCDEKRTQKMIADAAGVTEVTIRNRYKGLKEVLKLHI